MCEKEAHDGWKTVDVRRNDVPAQKASIAVLFRLDEMVWTRVCLAFEGNACLERQ
jgi:hypothetical protein